MKKKATPPKLPTAKAILKGREVRSLYEDEPPEDYSNWKEFLEDAKVHSITDGVIDFVDGRCHYMLSPKGVFIRLTNYHETMKKMIEKEGWGEMFDRIKKSRKAQLRSGR